MAINYQSLTNILEFLARFFSFIVERIAQVFFFSIAGVPVILLWIVFSSIFFTIKFRWLNIRGFPHAIALVRSKDHLHLAEEVGQVSPFQALTTALSGTVGLGNIAGVAIAIALGGAGAVFWMSLGGFFAMSSKFIECTLGSQYRLVTADGKTIGGPMYYLSQGLAKLNKPKLGKTLAVLFAIFCLGASLGGGNMFQANQSWAAVATVLPSIENYSWLYGLTVAGLVGLVIIGGINRIGEVTAKLVPLMVTIYLSAAFYVIFLHWQAIPRVITEIITQAFFPQSIEGGVVGLFVLAMRRSIFSHGGGLGSAAIAHAAAKNPEPIAEGLIAILEPFIDTVIICNITALVILLTGQYHPGTDINLVSGSELVAQAFAQVLPWFPPLLAVVIFLFGFSTMVTWSYYGEISWIYLFGQKTTILYKLLFLVFVFMGAVINLGAIVDFSDIMLLAMAIPNIAGCFFLMPQVEAALEIFWAKYIVSNFSLLLENEQVQQK